MLEATQHKENSFVTLTYSDDNVPPGGTLQPRDFTLWLKRLRKRWRVAPIRYYGVGEYGDKSWRPHYHAAVFGFPPCEYGQTRRFPPGRERSCCPKCDIIAETWGKGRIDLARLEPHSAQYVCGYISKKLTKADDPRLEGRYPEFARMSLKPGIGADFVPEIADVQLRYNDKGEEVPFGLRHGPKIMPLGRYLVRKLRVQSGREEGPSAYTQIQQAAKLHHLREIADQAPGLKKEVFKSLILEQFAKKVEAVERRNHLFRQRKRHL